MAKKAKKTVTISISGHTLNRVEEIMKEKNLGWGPSLMTYIHALENQKEKAINAGVGVATKTAVQYAAVKTQCRELEDKYKALQQEHEAEIERSVQLAEKLNASLDELKESTRTCKKVLDEQLEKPIEQLSLAEFVQKFLQPQ